MASCRTQKLILLRQKNGRRHLIRPNSAKQDLFRLYGTKRRHSYRRNRTALSSYSKRQHLLHIIFCCTNSAYSVLTAWLRRLLITKANRCFRQHHQLFVVPRSGGPASMQALTKKSVCARPQSILAQRPRPGVPFHYRAPVGSNHVIAAQRRLWVPSAAQESAVAEEVRV